MYLHKNKISIVVVLFFLIGTVLSACSSPAPTEDPSLKITEVAATVQAELTRIAALTPTVKPTRAATATATLIPATNTPSGPIPTATKTPLPTAKPDAAGANNSKFVKDVTVPDGSTFAHGEMFTKTWRFLNNGKTTWTTDYQLIYIQGNLVGAYGALKVNLPKAVVPGDFVDISLKFATPDAFGNYSSWWRLYTADGIPFGDYCSISIISGATAATPVYTPTATSTPAK